MVLNEEVFQKTAEGRMELHKFEKRTIDKLALKKKKRKGEARFIKKD